MKTPVGNNSSPLPWSRTAKAYKIYDTIHKDGQHAGEKGTTVHAVLLRQLLTTRSQVEHPGKARLMWAPTRCQLADGLTKALRGADIRDQIREGVLFHERALKRRIVELESAGKKNGYISVNVSLSA